MSLYLVGSLSWHCHHPCHDDSLQKDWLVRLLSSLWSHAKDRGRRHLRTTGNSVSVNQIWRENQTERQTCFGRLSSLLIMEIMMIECFTPELQHFCSFLCRYKCSSNSVQVTCESGIRFVVPVPRLRVYLLEVKEKRRSLSGCRLSSAERRIQDSFLNSLFMFSSSILTRVTLTWQRLHNWIWETCVRDILTIVNPILTL